MLKKMKEREVTYLEKLYKTRKMLKLAKDEKLYFMHFSCTSSEASDWFLILYKFNNFKNVNVFGGLFTKM